MKSEYLNRSRTPQSNRSNNKPMTIDIRTMKESEDTIVCGDRRDQTNDERSHDDKNK